MNTRDESYRCTLPSIGFRQQQILNALKNKNSTRAELGKECGIRLSSVCGRARELIRAGLIEVAYKKFDNQTNRNVEVLGLKRI